MTGHASRPIRAMGAILLAVLVTGCPVEGKRKTRVQRDAGAAPIRQAKVCKCPPGVEDEAKRQEVIDLVDSGTPQPGGTLRIHSDVDPTSLNPVLRPSAWIVRMMLHDVLEALVRRDPATGQFVGELAESWNVSDEGTRYVFKLREGVKWHDGKPFTSADVIHTLDLVMAPDSTAVSVKASLEEIEKYEATGKYEVTLQLTTPYALFFQHLEGLPILPKHLYVESSLNDHPANRAPVGTGPFEFVRWTSGKEIVIRRHDGYWGKPAWLDEIRYVIVKDRNVAFQMLKRGDIDLMARISADQYMEYDRDASLQKSFHRLTYSTPDISFLMYNTKNPLFEDPKVRLAMTLLLDRDRIRCAVHRCLARTISGPWPKGHPANDPSVKPWPFDPEKAAKLLAEAGFTDSDKDGVLDRNGEKFEFTFIIPTQSESVQRLGTIYQEELKAHGIVMQIKLLDWSAYIEVCRSHDFDMGVMSFQMEWDNELTGIFHTKSIDGGQNFISWSHDGVDYILEKARVTVDDDERNALLRDLHAILHTEQPYTFAFSPLETTLVSKKFRGARPSIQWYQERDIWKVSSPKPSPNP